ncbi:MAG: 3-methyl-2-oxobutanoate dehydrogenase subunit VorB [Lentisphaerae bacterium RIFOXYA12_FULL_48_11]|nr:MAG: 3-methyl-2-oxobutanoate dehydrogenase subunit VorB [Lentisphaerae bacterium RIFOXYA12_FULL_48_11]
MAKRVLMNGNDAIGEGAIRAGCDAYYGYPITPQNELTAYMATHMPEHRRIFIQAESEIAAINMVFGTVAAGKRAMTSSSSPGISLKQEGISFLAGAELPGVIVNVQRGGPGLGNIAPSQADYFQATKGGGHGDYHQIVLAPNSVQEMHDLTIKAFGLAEKYRNPVMILTDGRLGQMMEPLTLYTGRPPVMPPKDWAVNGARNRSPNFIRSLYLVEGELEALNIKLQKKYARIRKDEILWEDRLTRDCDVLLVAYGTSARIAKGALTVAREAGIRAGLIRPITLWPFPHTAIAKAAERAKGILVVEMSSGQMLEDVKMSVNGQVPVFFEGRMGGGVPLTSTILKRIKTIARIKKRR